MLLSKYKKGHPVLDFEVYAEKCIRIKTKAGTLLPLKFNIHQKRVWFTILYMVSKGMPIRIILLKARQVGGTTFFTALVYWLTANDYYKSSMSVAHDDPTTKKIFMMVRTYHEKLPEVLRPMTKHSSAKELLFENPSRS